MAYVFDAGYAVSEAASTSVSCAVPAGHQSGDLLLAIAQQDVGTGTLSVSGWTNAFSSGQSTINAQRTYAWYKFASSSNEADVLFESTLSDDWIVAVLVIRGAHQTLPINASAILSATGNTPNAPTVTTTVNDCLLIRGIGNDNGNSRVTGRQPVMPVLAINSSNSGAAGGSLAVGYQNWRSAGSTGSGQFLKWNNTAGGAGFTIAIADDGNAMFRVSMPSPPTPIRRFGIDTQDPTDTFEAPSVLGSTLFGVANVSTAVGGTSITAPPANMLGDGAFFWWASSNVNMGGVDTIVGTIRVLPATVDLSDSILTWAFQFTALAVGATNFGGVWIVFVDSSNNWSAFLVTTLDGIVTNTGYQVALDTNDAVRVEGSGTLNWSNIKKIGLLHGRRGSFTTARGPAMRDLMCLRKGDLAIVGSGNQTEWPFWADVRNALDGWAGGLSSIQGASQIVMRAPIQLGDGGTNVTRVNLTAASLETPLPYGSTMRRRWFNVGDNRSEIRIKAGANDVISLGRSVLSANAPQDFVIDAASSASANYDFNGCVLSGWRVKLMAAGVVVDSATFSECRGIELVGSISECTISSSAATAAVTTADPDNITDCEFVSGGAGHAIEITAPGTYTFSGNTFEGYGADGTTDAAIYNNSGGAVTLNITGGGDTPTVRNGTGASTTVNSGATLTLTGLEPGSDIVILDAGTTTERVNVDANAGTTYAYGYTAAGSVDICVYKVGYRPFAVRGYTLSTGDASLPVAQSPDPSYSNP